MLQAVHNCKWLTSFDHAQGYLQMPVIEEDVSITTFRARSLRVYEFTQMPFGLSNSGSSFWHLMEMCLCNLHFVTFLLYLSAVCVFATSIDEILSQNQVDFPMIKSFNLKIKLRKTSFYGTDVFRACLFFWRISLYPEKESIIGQCHKIQRSCIPSQDYPFITSWYWNWLWWQNVCVNS